MSDTKLDGIRSTRAEQVVEVATSGTVPRSDRCASCETPMLYRLEDERIVGSFCGHFGCAAFLSRIPE
jgi:hypothetical protein